MIALHCPKCNRTLSLPDRLRGSWVKCPACAATFQAPAETVEAALVPEVVEAAPAADPPAAAAPTNDAFAFESEKAGYRRLRVQTRIGQAVGYLHAALFSHFLIGLWCLAGGLFVGMGQSLVMKEAPSGLLVIPLVVVYYVPLVFLFLGASSLSRCSSYGLPMTAAIFAFVLSALAGVFICLLVLGMLARFHPLACVVLVLLLIALVAGLVGGIKTIQALNIPEILRLIERNTQG
jgi:hypothetical protein